MRVCTTPPPSDSPSRGVWLEPSAVEFTPNKALAVSRTAEHGFKISNPELQGAIVQARAERQTPAKVQILGRSKTSKARIKATVTDAAASGAKPLSIPGGQPSVYMICAVEFWGGTKYERWSRKPIPETPPTGTFRHLIELI